MKVGLFALTLFLGYHSLAQTTLSHETSNRVDEYIAHLMKAQQIPGMAIAVIKQGKLLKKSTYGLASIEYRVPVTDSSVFWIASISKHITATAIMQLKERGVIDLDVSIKQYLPDIPKQWEQITIRHLLTHTSGLPASGTGSERGHRSAAGTLSAEQMFENAKKDSLQFTPGDQFLYSDEGIFLIGYIIHKVSGQSFKAYMQQHIFEPANMTTAYLMDQFTIHPNQVSGYALKRGKLGPDRNSWRLIDTEINAAGGVYATIDDMIAWEKAMLTDDIISEESKQQMWASARLNNGCETAYGFAWNTRTIGQEPILYHPGIAGTEYLRFVNSGLSIIVLTNLAEAPGSIALGVANILGISSSIPKPEYKTAQPAADGFTNKELAALTGEYEFVSNEAYYFGKGFRQKISLANKNGELFINYLEAQPFEKNYRLVKLVNGRIGELSWYPVFIEMSYEPIADGRIKVYENYACVAQLYIGDLRRVPQE